MPIINGTLLLQLYQACPWQHCSTFPWNHDILNKLHFQNIVFTTRNSTHHHSLTIILTYTHRQFQLAPISTLSTYLDSQQIILLHFILTLFSFPKNISVLLGYQKKRPHRFSVHHQEAIQIQLHPITGATFHQSEGNASFRVSISRIFFVQFRTGSPKPRLLWGPHILPYFCSLVSFL